MSVNTSSTAATADTRRTEVAGAIRQAANATGAHFDYLLATAKMESDFNPGASAPTSSAKGLYQFIEQTWLGTVKEAGAQFGYGEFANAIQKSDSGSYSVADPATKAAILKLRDDPAASAAMAGVLTQSNSFKLTGQIGRRPTDGELYMAHFMGVGGAGRLISNAEQNPIASGAALFPKAAAANRSIFYERDGRARTVSQVYATLTARFDRAARASSTTSMAALGGASIVNPAAASTAAVPAYLTQFPSVAPRSAPISLQADATAGTQPIEPLFRTLYQGGERAEPVSPAVRALWGKGASLTQTADSARAPDVGAPKPLDLFSDRSGRFSS